jgi:CheY-like chemotaxis protein
MDKIKILLVEDDEFIRDIFKEILDSDGYAVTVATDGGQAFEQLKNGTWDLVLLDVMMPIMTGIDVIQKIRNEKIPVHYKKLIFLTNIDDGKEITELIALGDGYFMKSDLTPPSLVEKVKSILAK